ncbi:hypothetical protein GCM10027614_04820 [Micromonospora vulcania]
MILLSTVVVVPLILIVAAVVSFTGPPFYLQQRVGAGGRLFRVVKFRTMQVGAESVTGPVLAQPDDARVTRVGRWLRRSRLDELPQLWNVVRGEMSLVGPRPERPEFIADFQRLPHYDLRHLIRPGLTGIAQLTGGYAATVEDKLRCDLLYLNCRSMRVDLALLLLTVVELLRGSPVASPANTVDARVTRNTASMLAARVVMALCGLISVPVIYEHLGPREFGVWVVLAGLLAMAALVDLGLGSALVREVARAESAADRDLVRRLLGLGLGWAALLAPHPGGARRRLAVAHRAVAPG